MLRFCPQGEDECFFIGNWLAFLKVEMHISFSGIKSTTRGFLEKQASLRGVAS